MLSERGNAAQTHVFLLKSYPDRTVRCCCTNNRCVNSIRCIWLYRNSQHGQSVNSSTSHSVEREAEQRADRTDCLFRGCFGRLVPLMAVCMPEIAEIRQTLGFSSPSANNSSPADRNVVSPGEVLYVHQHGVLLDMQLIPHQQQLHQLLI